MAEGNWGSAGMHKVDIRNDLMFSYVMRNRLHQVLEVLLPATRSCPAGIHRAGIERDGAPGMRQRNRPIYAKGSIERNR